jgi:predicted adenylyl cyclase CyaB
MMPHMPRNVEIKARVVDWDKMLQRATAVADGPCKLLRQEDVFFKVPRGRLKLRIQDGASELIYYLRDNAKGPKESSYLCLAVPDPIATRHILGMIHGERGIIRKTRWLYMAGQTRIHLDRVEGLGDFLELEVVMRDDQSIEMGTAIAGELMRRLGIEQDQLLERAYMDLVES